MSVWIPQGDPGIVPVPPRNNQTGSRVRMFGWPKTDTPKTVLVYAIFDIVVMISRVRSYFIP